MVKKRSKRFDMQKKSRTKLKIEAKKKELTLKKGLMQPAPTELRISCVNWRIVIGVIVDRKKPRVSAPDKKKYPKVEKQ